MLRRRPSTPTVIFTTVAIACGVAAAGLTAGYARRIDATRPDLGPPVTVVVAAHELPRGTELTVDAIAPRSMPAELVPPGAVGDPTALVGRTLSSDVAEGEALTETRLAGSTAGPVAGQVPDGLVGLVIPSSLPPGSVVPGDRVDILATFGGRSPHTEVVATEIEVARIIATATESGASADGLVLVVDPTLASRFAYATAFATIAVAVRGPLADIA